MAKTRILLVGTVGISNSCALAEIIAMSKLNNSIDLVIVDKLKTSEEAESEVLERLKAEQPNPESIIMLNSLENSVSRFATKEPKNIQQIVDDLPKSKFIHKPKNNYRRR